MTECFGEIEDTRREMYRVAKQMVKLKDSLINQKHSTAQPQPRQTFNELSPPGKDIHTMRNTVGSPLKANTRLEPNGVYSSPQQNNGGASLLGIGYNAAAYSTNQVPQTLNFNNQQVL